MTHIDSCCDIKVHRERQFGLLLLVVERQILRLDYMFKICLILAAVAPIMETPPLKADRGYLKVKSLCVSSQSFIIPLFPFVFNF